VLVALYHFRTDSHVSSLGLVQHAYLFVDFFFVLSGFVITYAYADRLSNLREAGVMIWRRLSRLWPLHVAVLLALILLEAATPVLSWALGVQRSASSAFDPQSAASLAAVPAHLLLIQGLGFHDRLTWNHPSWSISTELWTYVLLAGLMVLARGRTMLPAVVLVLGSLAALMLVSGRYMAVDYDYGMLRCMAGFFVGHIAYRALKASRAEISDTTGLEILAIVAVLAFVTFAGRTPFEFAAPFVFAAAVCLFALERGAVSAVLKSRPLAALGLCSYSIYMVHALVIAIAHRGANTLVQLGGLQLVGPAGGGASGPVLSFGNAWASDVAAVVYLAIVVALARLTWRHIEMPAQRFLNGYAAAAVPSKPAAAASVGTVAQA
jgi:hypothetical protein